MTACGFTAKTCKCCAVGWPHAVLPQCDNCTPHTTPHNTEHTQHNVIIAQHTTHRLVCWQKAMPYLDGLNSPYPCFYQSYVDLDAQHVNKAMEPMWQKFDVWPPLKHQTQVPLKFPPWSWISHLALIQKWWMDSICIKQMWMTRYLSSSPQMPWSMFASCLTQKIGKT